VHEKNGASDFQGVSRGVAALHLTAPGLRGTVRRIFKNWTALMSRDSLLSRNAFVRGLAGAALGLALMAGGAQAANPLEKNFYLSGPRYDGNLGPCASALDLVAVRFAEKESTFWNSSLQILGYEHVREIAFRPWQSDNIPRRYCTARALISDGKPRTVNFSIIEDGGLAGSNDGVEFCVIGLDRNWAFNPACKAARP
jgi:hypothetical protein